MKPAPSNGGCSPLRTPHSALRTRIAPRTYADAQGRYWARYPVNRKYTWKLLAGVATKRAAITAAQTMGRAGGANTFAALAQLYLDAGCPSKNLETRTENFITDETARVRNLKDYFGHMPADEIRLKTLPPYAAWRRRRVRFGTGERTVDKDLCTLSNVLNYGIAIGEVEMNWISHNRPHYRKAEDVRHSRQIMPASADVIHQIVEHFFDRQTSQVFGWLTLFAMFTGCRTSELLRLRLDAASAYDPGHIAHDHLYLGRRSKSGVSPWCAIGVEFSQMLQCFKNWHSTLKTQSPHYFPSPRDPARTVGPYGHGLALKRSCLQLSLSHTTPHALRAYYVTKRRRDGISDSLVAEEIGDKTVTLISSTYGDLAGGDKLSWLPKDRLPAWQRWQTPAQKLAKVDFKVKT